MKMTKATRARYTIEFKQEAVRLVESGQNMAAAARSSSLSNPIIDGR
jgi:transposase